MSTVLKNAFELSQEKYPIVLDGEFKSMIPAQSEQELDLLEQDVLEHGIMQDLVAWRGHNILLDGCTRYALAYQHGLPYSARYLDFPNRDAAKRWVVRNQLGRRNLSEEDRKKLISRLTKQEQQYLLGKEYNERKRTQGRPAAKDSAGGANGKPAGDGSQGGVQGSDGEKRTSTAERIAKERRVSPGTVRRAGKAAEALDAVADRAGEKVTEVLLSGAVSATHDDIQQLSELPDAKLKEVSEKIVSGEVEDVGEVLSPLKKQSTRKPAKNGAETRGSAFKREVLKTFSRLMKLVDKLDPTIVEKHKPCLDAFHRDIKDA